jgi:hypothetical protein
MAFANPITGSGGTLLRDAIKSPGYVSGSSGWSINADGSAEFNDVTIRGDSTSGNALVVGDEDGPQVVIGANAVSGYVAFPTNDPSETVTGNARGGLQSPWSATDKRLVVQYVSPAAAGGRFVIASMESAANGGAVPRYQLYDINGAVNTPLFIIQATGGLIGVSTEVDGDLTVDGSLFVGTTDTELERQAAGTLAVTSRLTRAGETWQTPTFAANWASTGTLNGNSTFHGMQYRRDAEDNVWIYGAAVASGAGGTIFTLPSGYRPPTNNRALLSGWCKPAAGSVQAINVQVTDTGAVNVALTLAGITIAAGDQVWINGRFPLGNLS